MSDRIKEKLEELYNYLEDSKKLAASIRKQNWHKEISQYADDIITGLQYTVDHLDKSNSGDINRVIVFLTARIQRLYCYDQDIHEEMDDSYHKDGLDMVEKIKSSYNVEAKERLGEDSHFITETMIDIINYLKYDLPIGQIMYGRLEECEDLLDTRRTTKRSTATETKQRKPVKEQSPSLSKEAKVLMDDLNNMLDNL